MREKKTKMNYYCCDYYYEQCFQNLVSGHLYFVAKAGEVSLKPAKKNEGEEMLLL